MIFFYHGPDSFRAKQKIDAIINKFQEKIDASGHNVDRLDGSTMNLDDFFNSVRTIGFLAPKKLIIIKNIFENKNLTNWQDDIIKFLKTLNDSADENYIVFWETSKPDSRKKLYKTLNKFKYVEEFNDLNPSQLNNWVIKNIKTKNKDIDKDALVLLIASVGNNLWQLDQEINKLTNYTKQDIIDKKLVSDLVKAKIDDNIFTLVDALGNKNIALAQKMIDEQLSNGVSPQYILSMVIRQFRLIIKAKALSQKVKYSGALAQTLKIPNLVAEKALSQSKLYEMDKLKKIYQQLLMLDQKFKTTANQEKILFAKMINEL